MPVEVEVSPFQSFFNGEINVPPELPEILKQYTKAAIRTQPKDLIRWSAAYFRALADGEEPPVKERFEITTEDDQTWISTGTLRILHRQLHREHSLTEQQLRYRWEMLGLDEQKLNDVLEVGRFPNTAICWLDFLALTCRLAVESLTDGLRLLCEVVTLAPEGCAASIPFNIFTKCYIFLTKEFEGDGASRQTEQVLRYLEKCAEQQEDSVHPGNFMNAACPPLQS